MERAARGIIFGVSCGVGPEDCCGKLAENWGNFRKFNHPFRNLNMSTTPIPQAAAAASTLKIPHEALAGAIRALIAVAQQTSCAAIYSPDGMKEILVLRAEKMERWAEELKHLSIELCNRF
jgi:hypothetical protein